MSPLEHPFGVALLILSIPASVVVAIVSERRHTVKRNRKHRENGYVR